MLCTTLFRDECDDSGLLLSAVVSLPCEVSTETLLSDLELTRVSVDRFTAETTYRRGWFSLLGSVCREYKSLALRTLSKTVDPSSHPSPGLPDLEQSHAASPRARLLLRRPSTGAVLSLGQSAPMPGRLPTA